MDDKKNPNYALIDNRSIIEQKYFNIRLRYYLNVAYLVLILSALNFIFGGYLYDLSLDIMHMIEKEGWDPILIKYLTSLKFLNSNTFFYTIILFLFVFASKAFAFHYTFITAVAMFTFGYLKMLFKEPRPY